MVFSSAVFLLLFLPLTYVLNLIVGKRFSNLILLTASLLFYAWGEPVRVLLMIVSIIVNYWIGYGIRHSNGRKKLLLTAGLIIDLSVLVYYKYSGFLADCFNVLLGRPLLPVWENTLPVGISFFTFQEISYLIDVYRGDVEAAPSIIHTALYISFFPQLIAGPIVKYKDIRRYIEKREVSVSGTAEGFRRFIYGLGKKVLIANVLGLCADTVFAYDAVSIDWRTAWIGAIAYAFQIYYDFSGYSDMAIGLGRMFGFSIPENFRYPYLSKSISEFWRRWHISLGSWFREYVYIPLGGNRKGKVRTCFNLLLVFLLTGLWHGADLSFVLWGLYHGILSLLERLGLKKILSKGGILSILYTDLMVVIGWVLFRAEDTRTGLRYLGRMFSGTCSGSIPVWSYMDLKTVFVMAMAFFGMGVLQSFVPEEIRRKWKMSVPEVLFCTAILILCLSAIAGDTYNPFIYFQF